MKVNSSKTEYIYVNWREGSGMIREEVKVVELTNISAESGSEIKMKEQTG